MSKSLSNAFGEIIRTRREAANLSQEELGEKTNLSRNYIGMVERGETNSTLFVLHSLAMALKTTMVELISELELQTKTKRKS